MSLPTDPLADDDFEDLPEPAGTSDAAGNQALFEGDTGALPEATRRVLVKLLAGPTIDGQRHPKLWPTLLRDEAVVRARLHELFLELVIDHDLEVAFLRQVSDDELDVPVLLRSAQLTLMESALLLHLRERLLQAEGEGSRAVLDRAEMLEALAIYGKSLSTDISGLERRREGAVEKMKRLGVLRKLRGNAERYEVSPVLKLLFPAEQVQQLIEVYKGLSAKGAKDGTEASPRAGAKSTIAEDLAALDEVLAAEEAAMAEHDDDSDADMDEDQ